MTPLFSYTISGIKIGDPFNSSSLNRGAMDVTYYMTEAVSDNEELQSNIGSSLIGVFSVRGIDAETVLTFYVHNKVNEETKIIGGEGFKSIDSGLSENILISFDDTVMLTDKDQVINSRYSFVEFDTVDSVIDDEIINRRCALSQNAKFVEAHVPLSRNIQTSNGLTGGGNLNSDLVIGVDDNFIKSAITEQWLSEKIKAVANQMINNSVGIVKTL